MSHPIITRTNAWNGFGRIAGSRSGSYSAKLAVTVSRAPAVRGRLTAIWGVPCSLADHQQLRDLAELTRADDHVDVRRPAEDLPLVLLRHAAEDADGQVGPAPP